MVVRNPKTSNPTNQDKLTPAMRQYQEHKTRAGDAILLFRMGDFYEMFYEDAKTASRVLGIALTTRSKGENPIPLAGIPYHALDSYLNKLVHAGYKVAVSEQIEDAKLAKGVVKRDIVRIVTAGTLTDETLLDERTDNVLAAIARGKNSFGLATIELASGRFRVFDEMTEGIVDELVRIRPAEILIDDEPSSAAANVALELKTLCDTSIARRSPYDFGQHDALRTLHEHFDVTTLDGFGIGDCDASVRAAGAIIRYLAETQKTALTHITRIERQRRSDTLLIDHNTWRSLEIERTLRSGQRDGSLLAAIDRTVHPMGARRLRHWLCLPMVDIDAIVNRQDAVAAMVENEPVREHVRDWLRNCCDVERITARVALNRASPRDLVGLAITLSSLPALRDKLEPLDPPLIQRWRESLTGFDELANLLHRAIAEDAPATLKDGGVIASGFNPELDELRNLRRNGQEWLADYQKRQSELTGIPSLRVAYNRVFGFYIEISNTYRDRVPANYVRKQTIKAAERYITDELKEYETRVLTAEEKALALETKLFAELRDEVAGHVEPLQRVADAISRIDAVEGLAELAVERRYVRPVIDDSQDMNILEGRHPVLEQRLADAFVPNDTDLQTDRRLWIITGPNMAGKSTYMRQIAHMTLLAQMGSYVPAQSMNMGVVDRIFARVGAADEITRDKSTFMVEMTEAASILNNATDRSLVIMDELGRGTSTFDGLSLAWAITEHLAVTIRCRTLVATHYHELTELASLHNGVANYNVAVREWPDAQTESERIIFLHKIVKGGTNKSYGLHVAAMAGVPDTVVTRANELLDQLESNADNRKKSNPITRTKTRQPQQLSLFNNTPDPIVEELLKTDPDQTTPIEALQLLRKLQDSAKKNR